MWQKLDGIQKQTKASTDAGMAAAVDAAEKIRQWEDHMWATEKLASNLKTDMKNGLTKEQASDLLRQYGYNKLTEKGKTPKWQIFLHEQTGLFSLLLWAAGILCFFAYFLQDEKVDKSNLWLGIVLVTVVFITGCFSYAQTSNAADLMDQFKDMMPQKCMVTRDGVAEKRDASDLVPGDIVALKAGDQIPADVVLMTSNEMKVNNASLTGESEDLLRQSNVKIANIFESPNVAFFGTNCTNGVGTGIVFRTGDDTVIGRIANLSQSAEKKDTPLSQEIDRFIYIVTGVAVVLGVSFFIFGLTSGFGVIKNLVFAIGIIVANVPEGLLATVTVSLALTAQRMAGKMVLVKNMESVETLGSTSCICSDKTGTLTQNRMTVSQVFFNRKVVDASVNMEIYRKAYKKEEAKGKDGDVAKVKAPEYSQEDSMFMHLVHAIGLSTTCYFAYSPKDEDIRASYIKEFKLKEADVPEQVIDQNEELRAKLLVHKAKMVEDEKKRYFIKRETEGDASETGLIKFTMPILMKNFGGQFESGLDTLRDEFPIIMLNDNTAA